MKYLAMFLLGFMVCAVLNHFVVIPAVEEDAIFEGYKRAYDGFGMVDSLQISYKIGNMDTVEMFVPYIRRIKVVGANVPY